MCDATTNDFTNDFIETYTDNTIVDVVIDEHQFGIRAADVDDKRNAASMLINKMYGWRGYGSNHQIRHEPNRITLTASNQEGKIVGTMSLGIDSEVGLLADQVFKDCIDPYRQHGKVCEITKLAVDPCVKSKEVLASLFHVALLYLRDIHACNEIFIEVNPRHRRFYQSMLSFNVECNMRPNPRVDAPAVLLHINIEYGTGLISKFAGKRDTNERSLYPYFFSKHEEAGILKRLKSMI